MEINIIVTMVGMYNCHQTDSATSTDIDECEKGTDNCDDNAECTNTEGSFECTCNTGYEGSGSNCDGEIMFACSLFFFKYSSKFFPIVATIIFANYNQTSAFVRGIN